MASRQNRCNNDQILTSYSLAWLSALTGDHQDQTIATQTKTRIFHLGSRKMRVYQNSSFLLWLSVGWISVAECFQQRTFWLGRDVLYLDRRLVLACTDSAAGQILIRSDRHTRYV